MNIEKMREEFEAGWGFTNEGQDCYFIPELNSYGSERVNRSAESKSTAWHYFQKGWQASRKTLVIDPVFGDQLPPIGSKVQIHLGRSDALAEHTVAGYYVWGDLGGNESLSRVFVRVRDDSGYLNARLLKDVRPIVASVLGDTVSVPKDIL